MFRLRFVPDDTKIAFMKGRIAGLVTSAVLSIASIILFFYPGLNYGIDFRGGIVIEARTSGPAQFGALRSTLDGLGLGEAALQQFGGPEDVLIRLERQPGGDEAQQKAVEKVRAVLLQKFPGTELRSVEAVGFFAITGLQFNLTSLAAILTIMGYSINDKVVVYDRVRENLRKFKSMPLRQLIDLSINETLNRTINTSFTTFLATLPLALVATGAVQEFAIVILFGIVVGTSSSIFIAAPILLFLGENRLRRGTKPKLVADARP